MQAAILTGKNLSTFSADLVNTDDSPVAFPLKHLYLPKVKQDVQKFLCDQIFNSVPVNYPDHQASPPFSI